MSHPNLVQTYDVGAEDGHYFMVMEYLEGQPMHAVLGRIKRKLPLGVHLRILGRVLAGLHYAHELRGFDGKHLSVVHRDVSPQNTILCYDGQVKLIDFGIAKAAGAASRTTAGMFKGKLGYVAPEQVAGGDIDRRADIFCVGVMLWEALVGRRLTYGENEAAVHKRTSGTQARRRAFDGGRSELAAICDKTWTSIRRSASSAAEMRDAIDARLVRAGLRATEGDIVNDGGVRRRAQRDPRDHRAAASLPARSRGRRPSWLPLLAQDTGRRAFLRTADRSAEHERKLGAADHRGDGTSRRDHVSAISYVAEAVVAIIAGGGRRHAGMIGIVSATARRSEALGQNDTAPRRPQAQAERNVEVASTSRRRTRDRRRRKDVGKNPFVRRFRRTRARSGRRLRRQFVSETRSVRSRRASSSRSRPRRLRVTHARDDGDVVERMGSDLKVQRPAYRREGSINDALHRFARRVRDDHVAARRARTTPKTRRITVRGVEPQRRARAAHIGSSARTKPRPTTRCSTTSARRHTSSKTTRHVKAFRSSSTAAGGRARSSRAGRGDLKLEARVACRDRGERRRRGRHGRRRHRRQVPLREPVLVSTGRRKLGASKRASRLIDVAGGGKPRITLELVEPQQPQVI
jgi:serine/threonine protein kinase